ncbi:MAG: hypothetical protein M1819_005394 [Sarea resinae]|nr:MAG: hypothetical protein M1819_005394 [Sarea resinae]
MSATKIAITDVLALPNSAVKIPRLGFGVYRSATNVCVASCLAAFEAGYRHIDSAQYYGNERQVGEATRSSGLPRSSIFLTTKILSPGSSFESTYASVLKSVKDIDGEDGYVDLFLIHTPSSNADSRKTMWQALEKLLEEGKTRSIGVSNYGRSHIEEMKSFARVWPPHVNQIERAIVEYCQEHGIVIEGYSPLVRNQKAHDPTLQTVAEKRGKTTAQVLIRYCLQKGWVPLPKSDTPARIRSNIDVYDFELSVDDMELLDGLDQGERGAIVKAITS